MEKKEGFMQKILFLVLFVVSIISGCSTMDNREYVANKDNNLTVAKAQSQISVGMTGEQVASTLGSPNIVTNDSDGNETWVYDKISTENIASSAGGNIFLLLAGAGANTAASSSTQKTLTIIVKFDSAKKVRDIKYHQSAF